MKFNKFFLGLFIGLFSVSAVFGAQQEEKVFSPDVLKLFTLYLTHAQESDKVKRDKIIANLRSLQASDTILDVLLKAEAGQMTTVLGTMVLSIFDEDNSSDVIERKKSFLSATLDHFHTKMNVPSNVSIMPNHKITPLALAISTADNDLISLLVKYGASFEVPYEKNNRKILPIEFVLYFFKNASTWEHSGVGVLFSKRFSERENILEDKTPEINIFNEENEKSNMTTLLSWPYEQQDHQFEHDLAKDVAMLDTVLKLGASLFPVSKEIKVFRPGKTKAAMVGVLRKHKQGRPFVCSSEACNFDETHSYRAIDQKLKACSACENIWYCNADCQKADWKKHKTLCAALKDEKIIDEVVNLYKTFKLQETIFTVD